MRKTRRICVLRLPLLPAKPKAVKIWWAENNGGWTEMNGDEPEGKVVMPEGSGDKTEGGGDEPEGNGGETEGGKKQQKSINKPNF